MAISVSQTFNKDLIFAFLNLPQVSAYADGANSKKYKPEINDRNGWFLCKEEGTIIALIHLYQVNNATVEIHPHFINSLVSRKATRSFYSYFLKNITAVSKIICMTPEKFRTTLNFARKMGLIDEGYIKESYNSKGKLIGVHILGITRDEIEAFLYG